MTVRHRNNFDLIRLLAALEVVIGHSVEFFEVDVPALLEPLYTVIRWFPGVPIFFALSGYLLAKSLDRNSDLVNYARNRSLRIFPALWACTLATLGLLAAAGLLFQLSPAKLVAFVVGQSTIGQFWVPSPLTEFGVGAPYTPNPSLWTIRVEIGFYFILPFLILGGRALLRSAKRLDIALVLIGLVSFGIYVFYGYPENESNYSTLLRLFVNSPAPYLWQFLVGVMLHRHEDTTRRLFTGKTVWWLGLFLAIRGTVFLLFEVGDGSAPLVALGIANFFLVAPSFALAFSSSDLVRRLQPPEDISYGVYLWHMVLLNAIVHWQIATGWVGAALVFFGSILVGHLSWRYVEAPALARKKRALRPTRPAPTTA